MFGYVQPCKPEMKVKDFDKYKAYYCGLCKILGKEYGMPARSILSYDCTFYAIVDISLHEKCQGIKKGRCTCNPLKKCSFAQSESEGYSRAAALSVVSVYYKLVDNIADSSFFKSILYRLLKLPVSVWRKKAKKKYPQIEEIVAQMSKNQFEVEKDKDAHIDLAADPTAKMLKSIMLLNAEDEKDGIVFSEFGYHLGKWIYLIDAADDMQKDEKKGDFNPFVTQLIEKQGLSKSEVREYQNSVLNQSVARCAAALGLMDFEQNGEIIENVICLGLADKQRQVLFEERD